MPALRGIVKRDHQRPRRHSLFLLVKKLSLCYDGIIKMSAPRCMLTNGKEGLHMAVLKMAVSDQPSAISDQPLAISHSD